MVKRFLLFLILLLLSTIYLLNSSSVFAGHERVNELRQRIQELEQQAAEYRKQIAAKHVESESLKKELTILDNRIARLRIQIAATKNRIELTSLEIQDLRKDIFVLSEKIDENRSTISSLLRKLYFSEKQDLVAVVLANPRLSDFFNQIEYLNNLQSQLVANLHQFLELKEEFGNRKELAENKKQELETLNQRQRNQQTAFEGTKVVKNDLLVKTKGEEKRYQQLLSEVERKKAEFYQELQKLESAAREQGIFIVRVKASSVPRRGSKIFSMPMDSPIITQGYGMTSFAKRGVYGGAPHNGIDMTAGFGSEIRSIGAGTVLAKGFNNAAGNWVAIRHDNDLVSIYGHMKEPAIVLVGERVDANSIIGFEGATGFVTGSHLHLSVYHEFFTFIGPKTGQVYFNYFQGSLNPLDYI